MTTIAVRSSLHVAIPFTQNTAPVYEFRCLYTHDVRRKQKRWQDGRIKFHTFNKRLMVYDDTQNFIGDSHWKEEGELQPDDEIALDDGVIVQVGDLLHTTQTDLKPLFEREHKRVREHAALAREATSAGTGACNRTNMAMQKHRSLNTLLRPSKGSYGLSAISGQSPFEVRKSRQENEWHSEREIKRSKTSKMSLDCPTRASQKKKNSVPQIVDMTFEEDNIPSSDITLPSSPNAHRPPTQTFARVVGAAIPVPRTPKTMPPPPVRGEPSSPPVSTKNSMRHIKIDLVDQFKLPPAKKPNNEQTPSIFKTKHLRIGKPEHRPMLLCHKTAHSANDKAKDVDTKRRRPNLYETLSDLESEAKTTTNQPFPKKRKPVSQPKIHKGQIDPNSELVHPSTASGTSGRPIQTSQTISNLQVTIQGQNIIRGKPGSMLDPDKNEKGNSVVAFVNSETTSKAAGKRNPAHAKKPTAVRGNKKVSQLGKTNAMGDDEYLVGNPREPLKESCPPPTKEEQGPWTIEATELFDWRPPDWEERQKRMKANS